MWSSNARLYVNASNLDVLKQEDQNVLPYSILDRDLYLSLQLSDEDDIMASVNRAVQCIHKKGGVYEEEEAARGIPTPLSAGGLATSASWPTLRRSPATIY